MAEVLFNVARAAEDEESEVMDAVGALRKETLAEVADKMSMTAEEAPRFSTDAVLMVP